MAAFVGYVVQSNFVFPWPLTTAGIMHPSTDLSPPEQWDALPFESKLQIILFIGFLEFYSELQPSPDSKSFLTHYTKPSGIPGKFVSKNIYYGLVDYERLSDLCLTCVVFSHFPQPTFEDVPHPIPLKSLYDPLNLSKNKSAEAKAKGLKAEINNGRLAQLGIFGSLCEQTIPGSAPLGIVIQRTSD
jgi:Chlorophyll A-B binding protein